MTATLIILALSAILFVSGKMRSDLVAVCSALALVLTGVLTPEEALAGFSSPIVIMMTGLFVVGGGIFSTGLAKRIGTGILGLAGTSETRLFILLMLTTAVVGAFVSNTGTVALMLPIVVSMARGAGLSPSRFLMPLAFAGSMGGMLTLIGTPPNLIVRDALVGAGYAPLGFFSFTPIGIVCIVVGTVLLLPLSRRFLKGRIASASTRSGKSLQQLTEEYKLAQDLHCLQISENSSMVGHTLKELDVRRHYGITILEVRRSSLQGRALRKLEQFAMGNERLIVGDVLYATGTVEQIDHFASELQLSEVETSRNEGGGTLNFYDVGMAEILVLPASTLVGQTVEQTGFRSTYGLNVLGIRRHTTYLLDDLKDQRIHASDIVLVQGRWSNITKLNGRDGQEWVILGQPLEQAAKVTLDYKAPLAALIMVLMVALMAFDFIPIAPVTAVMLAAVAMIFTGCLRSVEAALKTINWESIILFGAMLPMSTALEKTGLSQLISQSLVDVVGGHGGMLLIACVYVATSLMTFFISNTVTAVLMAPIALQAAQAEGLNAVPVLLAVTVAASMCFASPFSTPPNALVMSAGGYKPIDYIKVGLPLQVVIGIVMVVGLGLWA
jgi:di/tricarboxylate transporter